MTNPYALEYIYNELSKFKIRPNSISYLYLVDAIYIVTKEKRRMKNFKALVYYPIAIKYGTKPQNVLWDLNKLIDLIYINTDVQIINNYFQIYSGDKISTKTFICVVSRKVSKQIINNKAEMNECHIENSNEKMFAIKS